MKGALEDVQLDARRGEHARMRMGAMTDVHRMVRGTRCRALGRLFAYDVLVIRMGLTGHPVNLGMRCPAVVHVGNRSLEGGEGEAPGEEEPDQPPDAGGTKRGHGRESSARFRHMPTPFACDMTAIPMEKRGAHHALIRRLMIEGVRQIRELPDGLAFQFPAEEYGAVTEFVRSERLCCPFLTFTVEVAPELAALQLRITGDEGVKEFIRAELQLPAVTR